MAIRTYDASPQQRLAAAIHGTILGPSTIEARGHLVTASPIGIVRCDGVTLGAWCDQTEALAQAFAEAVAS